MNGNLNSDLEYSYLAPAVSWRGGRWFKAEHSAAAPVQMGYAEITASPVPQAPKAQPKRAVRQQRRVVAKVMRRAK